MERAEQKSRELLKSMSLMMKRSKSENHLQGIDNSASGYKNHFPFLAFKKKEVRNSF